MRDTRLIRCPFCGETNRVPLEQVRKGLEPECGRRKTRRPVALEPVTVTDAAFEAEVERFPLPVLLGMWAERCGPRRLIAPLVDELASKMIGRVRVAKLNVDENPTTAERFQVRSIPTPLGFKGGKEVDRVIGIQSKSEIARRLQRQSA